MRTGDSALLDDLITEEIGPNVDRCDAILRALRGCQQGVRQDAVFMGNTFMLTLRRSAATIRPYRKPALDCCELPLEDLEEALLAWRRLCSVPGH
jgi:hypothetical protein